MEKEGCRRASAPVRRRTRPAPDEPRLPHAAGPAQSGDSWGWLGPKARIRTAGSAGNRKIGSFRGLARGSRPSRRGRFNAERHFGEWLWIRRGGRRAGDALARLRTHRQGPGRSLCGEGPGRPTQSEGSLGGDRGTPLSLDLGGAAGSPPSGSAPALAKVRERGAGVPHDATGDSLGGRWGGLGSPPPPLGLGGAGARAAGAQPLGGRCFAMDSERQASRVECRGGARRGLQGVGCGWPPPDSQREGLARKLRHISCSIGRVGLSFGFSPVLGLVGCGVCEYALYLSENV